jgi:SAM-dependent methyltransferase
MEELKEFDQSWYDDKYFADKEGKAFKQPDGSVKYWGYKNPDGEYIGADKIAKAWKTIFQPENMLDVGCGRGTFVAYARLQGIPALGFDYSEWAIRHPHPKCEPGWIFVHDATKHFSCPDKVFDLVMGTDILEHIYEDDLTFVIDEIYRLSRRWVFLQIPVVDGVREKGYILKRGERIPFEDGRTWAGHVTVCTADWWRERLERDDWQERRDMVNWFCALVDPIYIKNWLVNMLYIAERIG